MKKTLVWFRNDLRIQDNETLAKAALRGEEIIPLYCFDPRQFGDTALGFPKTGSLRAAFLIESVADLRKSLQKAGGDLIIRVGKPEDIVPQLTQQYEITAVYASKEVTSEETFVEDTLERRLWKQRVPLEFFWTSTLLHIDDLPFPIVNLPDVFTDFRKEAEKAVKVRPLFASPQRISLPTGIAPGHLPMLADLGLKKPDTSQIRGVMPFRGGETEGIRRLHEYFWERDGLRTYKETRNGMLGADYSSKFSTWLSNGCLSPRLVHQEVKRYEEERVKNESTYWLVFELLWRDYFRFVAKKYGNRIFSPSGIKNDLRYSYREDEELFERWKDGLTGIPFIDANMRELKATGFMSNRGRQNVGSFLTKDLNLNWTWGAAWFESQLIDYDVCSNWCNWNYVAGVGNDPRENRYFNILSQAKRYDPQGEYVKHWLPELVQVPANRVHQPTDLSLTEQSNYDLLLGRDYPHPVVNPQKWVV